MKKKTNCKRGHDLTVEANIYIAPKTGLRSCRKCRTLVNVARAKVRCKLPEVIEYKKQWFQKNRNRVRKQVRASELKIKYGITSEQYAEMFILQGGVCAICKQAETSVDNRHGKIRVLAVDYCHTTNKVRGLLCQRCNHAIGMLRDNPTLCRIAAGYLEINA